MSNPDERRETAIIRVPRRAMYVPPITVRFMIGPASPERAAALARQIGLLRAEMKLHRLVLVRPHVRRWPARAN